VANALLAARRTNSRALAFFTRTSRAWTAGPLAEEEIARFRSYARRLGYDRPECLLPHGTYLANCASSDPDVRAKSIAALKDECDRCHKLGITYYNFHPGSKGKGGGGDEDDDEANEASAAGDDAAEGAGAAACGGVDASTAAACARVSAAIDEVHAAVPAVTLVVECMAGQGGVLGRTVEEVALILDKVKDKSRVGFCIDTAHAFGAGYDITTAAGWKELLDSYDAKIGLKQYLKGCHLNDSAAPLNSNKDRHWSIGRGLIGIEGFRAIMNDPRVEGVPLILETPMVVGTHPTPSARPEDNSDGSLPSEALPKEDEVSYKDEIALLYGLVGTQAGDAVQLPKSTGGQTMPTVVSKAQTAAKAKAKPKPKSK
jgi:apurinic endonuclease APN1